jgi:hypothetical protein
MISFDWLDDAVEQGAVEPDVAAEIEAEEDPAPNPLPRWGVVQGRGKCRVLAYLGRGYFELLTCRDARLHLHRDRITFLP